MTPDPANAPVPSPTPEVPGWRTDRPVRAVQDHALAALDTLARATTPARAERPLDVLAADRDALDVPYGAVQRDLFDLVVRCEQAAEDAALARVERHELAAERDALRALLVRAITHLKPQWDDQRDLLTEILAALGREAAR